MGTEETDDQSRVDEVRDGALELRDDASQLRQEAVSVPSSLEIPGESRVSRWLLLSADRWKVAVVLMATVLVALVALSVLRPVDVRGLLRETNTVQTLFNTLLSGIILLVSIVVSINSVFLSQEITDIESQEQRIDASVQYRNRIEDYIKSEVSPARPAEFLRVILGTIDRQAEALADHAEGSDGQFADEASDFADRVHQDAQKAGDTLHNAQFGTFDVLLAGLNYNYSWQLNVARRFKRKYGDALDGDENQAIDELIETLKFFATGREYFKSLYYKRELARLSSRLLYVSLPAIVFTSYVLLALDSNLIPEMSILGVSPLVVFVSVAYTLALGPYLIFTAYILRAATITQRTLSAGPFLLQQSDVGETVDWDTATESIEWNMPGDDDGTPKPAAEAEASEDESDEAETEKPETEKAETDD